MNPKRPVTKDTYYSGCPPAEEKEKKTFIYDINSETSKDKRKKKLSL